VAAELAAAPAPSAESPVGRVVTAAPVGGVVTATAAAVGANPAVAAGSGPRAPRGARVWLAGTLALTAGSVAAAIALAPARSAPAPEGLAFLLFVGSSVHVASTGWFYCAAEVRAHMHTHRGRYVWGPLALITGAGAIALLLPQPVLDWLLLPYFGWQFFHYQKQNLGIAALAAASRRVAPLTRGERRALTAAGLAAVSGLLARPAQLQLGVRPVLQPLFPVALLAFAVAVTAGCWCLSRRARSQRPASFCAVYLTSLAFGLPVFVFSSPYASVAGMTIAHGLQYLLLMSLVAAGGGRGRARILPLAALANVALLGGAALSVASDQLADTGPMRILFGVFLGAVMAHFVIDAGLWRMRADFPRAFLRARLPYLVPAAVPLAGPAAVPGRPAAGGRL
jgi:hypothetical protein